MKTLTTIISAMAFGLALFQPMAASAKDKDQKEKGKGRQGNSDNRQQAAQQPRASAPVARSKGGQGRAQSVNVQQGNVGRAQARSVQNQTQNARNVQATGPATVRLVLSKAKGAIDANQVRMRRTSQPGWMNLGNFTEAEVFDRTPPLAADHAEMREYEVQGVIADALIGHPSAFKTVVVPA